MTWRIPNPQALYQQLNIALGDLAKYLDRRQPRTYFVGLPADYALTAAMADVTGLTLTVDAGPKGGKIVVTGNYQFVGQVVGGNYYITTMLLDGNTIPNSDTAGWLDVFAGWHVHDSQTVNLQVGPGTHVVKVRAQKTVNAGTSYMQSTSAPRSNLNVVVYPD